MMIMMIMMMMLFAFVSIDLKYLKEVLHKQHKDLLKIFCLPHLHLWPSPLWLRGWPIIFDRGFVGGVFCCCFFLGGGLLLLLFGFFCFVLFFFGGGGLVGFFLSNH